MRDKTLFYSVGIKKFAKISKGLEMNFLTLNNIFSLQAKGAHFPNPPPAPRNTHKGNKKRKKGFHSNQSVKRDT